MKVSVLLPTRERSLMAKQAIDSLGEGDFEVLLYVDADDPELKRYKALESDKIKVFTEPRLGYANFHKMVNFLSSKSKGEWLLLWNDDMRINGDWKVPDQVDKPQILNFWDPFNMRNNLAPMVSRKMYELMGHFSLSVHCDSWVQDIANELGIHVPVEGVSVTHFREQLNDATKSHSQGVYPTSSPEYDGPEMTQLRNIDRNKIRENLL